jgi:hypothetical protein
MVFSGAWGILIHEENQKSKISWHFPFNSVIFQQAAELLSYQALRHLLGSK